MRTSPIVATEPAEPSQQERIPASTRSAERAYLGSTIAAMLALLASLWLFR